MRPLYDARVEDLGPDDRVVVECGCGHVERLTAAMLATAGVAAIHACSRPQAPAQMPGMPMERPGAGVD
jgi:hypothetical protein